MFPWAPGETVSATASLCCFKQPSTHKPQKPFVFLKHMVTPSDRHCPMFPRSRDDLSPEVTVEIDTSGPQGRAGCADTGRTQPEFSVGVKEILDVPGMGSGAPKCCSYAQQQTGHSSSDLSFGCDTAATCGQS